jgi:hypothetical protein
MISRYCVTAPIRAILDKNGGQKVSVMLPAGAILYETSQHIIALSGMIGVVWGGRNYSVHPKDLYKKAERFSTA